MFDDFELSFYPAQKGEDGIFAGHHETRFDNCKTTPPVFPANLQPFHRQPRAGQTFMSSCIANEVISRGFSVIYDSRKRPHALENALGVGPVCGTEIFRLRPSHNGRLGAEFHARVGERPTTSSTPASRLQGRSYQHQPHPAADSVVLQRPHLLKAGRRIRHCILRAKTCAARRWQKRRK